MFSRQKKSLVIAALLLSIIVLWTMAGQAEPRGGWQAGEERYHPYRVIVRFADVYATAEAVASMEQLGYSIENIATFQSSAAFPNGLKLGIVEVPAETGLDESITRLQSLPGILYAEKDYIRYKYDVDKDTPLIPNDPLFSDMWGLHNIGVTDVDPYLPGDPVVDADIDAPEAWAMHTGTGEVVVAVIDTGCYIEHPELAPNIWVNEAEMGGQTGVDDDGNGYIDDFWGWNYHNGSNQVFDPNDYDQYGDINDEHGTHVAGIIGAQTNNGVGIAGINWDIQIIVLKFIGGDGGYTSDAIRAFQYAADKEAKVINCSWGGGSFNQSLKDAIEASGAVVVCAAGNSGDNTDVTPHYPSSYDSPNIISVAAMDQRDMPADYPGWWGTCYGLQTVDLYAPGGYILSTVPRDTTPIEPWYAYFYGTSMAAPHVTGSAALLHSLRPQLPLYQGAPNWSPGEQTIKDAILDSVDVKPSYQGTVSTGGRLNLVQALLQVGGPVITAINAEPSFGPPPLEVAFSAEAHAPMGHIVDQWWDFGDGSEPIHQFAAVHIYEEQDDYIATFHAVDAEGNEATASLTIKVFYPPEIAVDPVEIYTYLEWGETEEQIIKIENIGLGELDYTAVVELFGMVDASGQLTPLGAGGPDAFGYLWFDSDEPDVAAPIWEDISSVGTRLVLGGDDSQVIDLPFEFPFYGVSQDSVRISSNGYLTFGATGNTWSPQPIPNTSAPNDLIAPFWCDLEPQNEPGRVFYFGDQDKFVVQYQNVPRYSYGGSYTFQVILRPSGVITYHYEQMLGDRVNDATVGIENSSGTVGTQVAYKEDYVHDDLAVFLIPGWVILDKNSGTVAPEDADFLTATFSAHCLTQGTWQAAIRIMSNDPANPVVDVNTSMFAKSIIPPRIRSLSAEPWAGSAPLTVQFMADVIDVDGEIVEVVWDFGDGSAFVTDTLAPVHTYTDEGEYTATLTVTDDDGLEAEETVRIVVEDLPQLGVEPLSFRRALRAHRESAEILTLTNIGQATLEMMVEAATALPSEDKAEPLAAGGPDEFGYLWTDSNQPGGPIFQWVEINEVGTELDLAGDDSKVVPLPFEFPFYGDMKTQIRICSDGYLTFDEKGNAWQNTSIPNPQEPNDLLAVYWDDLNPPYATAAGGVFYYYDQAEDRFIVEWKEVPRFSNNGSYTFQALLYQDGTIVYQYKTMQFTSSYVARGTIGLENAAGTDGLQVLYNQAGYMEDGLAIKFRVFRWLEVESQAIVLEPGESAELDIGINLGIIGSGQLDGFVVIDTNDIRKPRTVVPVSVEVLPNSAPVITSCGVNPQVGPMSTVFQFVGSAHDPDGQIADKWWDFGDGSAPVHTFVAEHVYSQEGEFTATFTVVDNDGYQATATANVTVRAPASASWNPKQLDFALGQGQMVEGSFTLSNVGTGTLLFGPGQAASQVQMLERLVQPEDIRNPNARIALGIYEANPHPDRSLWLPDEVGSVITSWIVPAPIGDPWGVGTLYSTDEVAIADALNDPTVDYVVTNDGKYTGKSWSANFGGDWAGDMAFDGTYMWQVNVGGDNAIHKIDPATGSVVGSIRNAVWAGVSQRGLAYNHNDDTFYIGGWNEDIIYKFKGESWDNPGEVIESWAMGVGIAGLAYHPKADVLLVTNNGAPDMIFYVDPVTHATFAQFPHPAGGEHMGVGCELDRNGNLWVAAWGEKRMYLVETGLGAMGVGDWLSWEPADGQVLAGETQLISVTIDANNLGAGVHEGKIVLATNDFDNPLIMIPVTATVAAAPKITDAHATPVFGEPPLEVVFEATFVPGGAAIVNYGWEFGDGQFSAERNVTHIYTEPGIYQAVFSVEDENGARAETSLEIEVKWLPKATVEPKVIEVTLPITGSTTEVVTVGNEEGNAVLDFEVSVKGGAAPIIAMPKRIGTVTDELAATARGLYDAIDSATVELMKAAIAPDAVGAVVESWEVPLEIDTPWGVGYDGQLVWIGDPILLNDHLVTSTGMHTGTIFGTPWAGSWPGDMAYDSNRNLMWQVNVGGDNGIYGLDPQTGQVVMSITSGPWTSVSQRGLAYDAETDTFYIGGWNEDLIYHIYGPSHANPGSVIAIWEFTVGIAGLAWHPAGMLWVTNNGSPDMIFGLDLDAVEIVYQFPHPAGLEYSGAGLSLNSDGNLWVTSMDNWFMYLINTEMPLAQGIVVDPAQGTIAPGETAELEVTINAAELGSPGDVIKQHLEIRTNDPDNAYLNVDLIINIEAGPTITEITATPEIGEPPLEVAFLAAVEAGAVDLTDFWWDFGDGSEPVHVTEAQHTYSELGEYTATFTAIDANGVEASAEVTVTVKWLPVLGIYPEEFDETIQLGEVTQTFLTISNTGVAPMEFSITVAPSFAESPEWKDYRDSGPIKGDYASEPKGYAGLGAGGPDHYGYIWMDSTGARGPQFDWIEISNVGTKLALEDETVVHVDLPFAFPFYGDEKLEVGICSNGYLTFGNRSDSVWTNTPLPEGTGPSDLVAVFWDDLDPSLNGDVYYYHEQATNRFIVEYKEVSKWSGSESYTFQVILDADGTIVYQYLEMNGDLNNATVGIQDARGADGLQVVYNAPYIKDKLAIVFAAAGPVVMVNPDAGMLVPGGKQDVVLTLGSVEAVYGEYLLNLYVATDDPYRPLAQIPVLLTINAAPQVKITAPQGGDELHGMTEVIWEAIDPDHDPDELLIDLAWTRDGEEWHDLAVEHANTGSFEWNSIEVGEAGETFRLRAKVSDPSDACHEFVTDEFTISNDEPLAKFSFAPSPATRWDMVQFTDESTDDGWIVAWHWDFGDGEESIEQNPEHRYTEMGEFEIRLVVTDNGGLTAETASTIEVGNAVPLAAFSYTPEAPDVGELVSFANESADDSAISACFWEFGDGATSSEWNPKHRYSSPGIFTVKLTVIDDDGVAAWVEQEIEVMYVNLPPVVEIVKPTAGEVLTGKETIRWHATDPDDDPQDLEITLYYKAAESEEWLMIASGLENTGEYLWDTSLVEKGGRYMLKVSATDPDGECGAATSGEFIVTVLSRAIVAAPNPTADAVTFFYDLPADGTLYVYTVAGQLVYTAKLPAAAHALDWNLQSNGKPIANGVYLYFAVSGEGRSELGRLVVNR